MDVMRLRSEDEAIAARGSFAVPAGWTMPSVDHGRVVLVPLDPEPFRGVGFFPNVTAIVEAAADDEVTRPALRLGGDRWDTDRSSREVSLEVSAADDQLIGQLVVRYLVDGTALIMVCSAALASWPIVAADFDAMAASVAVELEEVVT